MSVLHGRSPAVGVLKEVKALRGWPFPYRPYESWLPGFSSCSGIQKSWWNVQSYFCHWVIISGRLKSEIFWTCLHQGLLDIKELSAFPNVFTGFFSMIKCLIVFAIMLAWIGLYFHGIRKDRWSIISLEIFSVQFYQLKNCEILFSVLCKEYFSICYLIWTRKLVIKD